VSDEAQALKFLLANWRAPAAPDDLRTRFVASYRQLMNRDAAEEEEMKYCPSCHKEFAPQFRFCPIDGLPLVAAEERAARAPLNETRPRKQGNNGRTHVATAHAAVGCDDSTVGNLVASGGAQAHEQMRARAEYHLTILAEAGLGARLLTEVRAVALESQLTWPEFRRDPAGFARRTLTGYGLLLRRRLAQENVAYGFVTAFVVVLTLVCTIVVIGRLHRRGGPMTADNVRDDLQYLGMVNNIPMPEQAEEGPAGMAKHGTGGGSAQNHERPGGGGGGGDHEALTASNGRIPQATLAPPLLAPNVKPPVIENPHLPTPATIQADPMLFPSDPRPLPYGDPKSQAQELSNGSGDGGGIGDGHGGGIGSGNGTGYGPGDGWNTGGGPPKIGGGGPSCCGGTVDYAKTVFTVHNVTKRAVILSKPEPTFTEEARKDNVTGEVILRMVLGSNGAVTNIVPIKGLPSGLTERAMAAARQIQFTPAEKDGHRVSQYVTVSYNFNIY
jgi:TonB family protein